MQMNEKMFAEGLRRTAERREASWSDMDKRYTLSWHDAALDSFEGDWPFIVSVLLTPEYADVWCWCDKVLGVSEGA